jgi:IS30 family transposase
MKLYTNEDGIPQKLLRRVFTYEERVTLQSLLAEGFSQKECSQHLKRSPSVINREVHRVKKYYFKAAEYHARRANKKRGRKRSLNYSKIDELSRKLNENISPSIIVMKKMISFKVSIQTIYN